MKEVTLIVKDAFKNWSQDKISSWSAALAYYTAFSLSPLLLLLVSLVSVFVSKSTIQHELSTQLQGLIGSQSAGLISDILQNAKDQHAGLFATIISIILLILGASGVFGQLQTTLDIVFHVEPKPNQGFFKVLKDRFLSFSMIIVIAFLLIVSLAASTGITVLSSYFTHLLPITGFVLEGVNFLFSLLMITILFMIIFAVLPGVKIPRKVLLFGGVTTAVLFTIGKTLIGLYLGRGTTSTFGAAASLATLLLWIYYSSLIFFFGAELMRSYATIHGIELIPKKDAKHPSPEKIVIKPQVEEKGAVETALSYILSGLFLSLFKQIGLGKEKDKKKNKRKNEK